MYTDYTYLGGPVAHCTPGVRLRDRSQKFTTPWTAIFSERRFRPPAVRIRTVPRSSTQTVHLSCVYTNYTYLGDPVSRCTIRVRLRDRSRLFTIPYATICSLRNFRTPAVRICTVPQSSTRTLHLGCVYTNYTYLGVPVAHCTRVYDSETTHGSSPYHRQQSEAYDIFVHLLYGSVQFNEVVPEQCTNAVCIQVMPTWEVP